MREMQVWRESRLGQNSGNMAALIKHIEDRCGGQYRKLKEKWQTLTSKPGKHKNRHAMKLKRQDHDRDFVIS